MARVVAETSRDPTSHNLWPLEILIALAVGVVCSLIGTALGSLLLMPLLLLLIALLVAGVSGVLLLRAILQPMQRILEAFEAMRTGNLNARLVLERRE